MSFCSRHLHRTNKTFNIDVTVSSCMFLSRADSFTFSVSLSECDYHNCRQTDVLTLIWEGDRSDNLFQVFVSFENYTHTSFEYSCKCSAPAVLLFFPEKSMSFILHLSPQESTSYMLNITLKEKKKKKKHFITVVSVQAKHFVPNMFKMECIT